MRKLRIMAAIAFPVALCTSCCCYKGAESSNAGGGPWTDGEPYEVAQQSTDLGGEPASCPCDTLSVGDWSVLGDGSSTDTVSIHAKTTVRTPGGGDPFFTFHGNVTSNAPGASDQITTYQGTGAVSGPKEPWVYRGMLRVRVTDGTYTYNRWVPAFNYEP